ncbi:MAG TPA: hypothetical protein VH593_26635 [Ktedonobacteraceae bacterium]|jgi:hypothetical protein
MSKSTVQKIVVAVVLGVWIIGVIVALTDGITMLRVTTPLMTTVVGWLFTETATGG